MNKSICLVFASTILLLTGCGPDLSEYQQYREPTYLELPPQQMLVAEVDGPPSEASKQAFSTLFDGYYSLDHRDEGVKESAPRARWILSKEDPSKVISGRFAIPVSAKITALPEDFARRNPPLSLETWNYSTVAMILHTGPYNKERPTIERLLQFIADRKLTITGLHEEIYLKGPGMFFRGNEDAYQTLILYPVSRLPEK